MYSFEVTPVIGLPQFDGWSQVVTSPDSSFACLISVASSHASNVGRDLVDFINSQIPQNSAMLYSLAKKVLFEAEKKDARVGFVMLMINHTSVSMLASQGQVYLKRENKLGQVLNAEEEIKMIEGPLKVDDTLIMLSNQSQEFIEEIKLKINQGYEMDTIVTSLIPSLHALENSSLRALIFLKVKLRHILADTNPEEMSQEFISITTEPAPTVSSPPIAKLPETEEESDPIYPPELVLHQTANKPAREYLAQASQKSLDFSKLVMRLFIGLGSGIKKLVKSSFQGEVYVGGVNKRKWAKRILPALIILIPLFLGGYYYFSQRQSQIDSLNTTLAPILTNINQGKSLSESDPILAREVLANGLAELNTLKAQTSPAFLQKIIDTQITDTQAYLDTISGKEELQELPVFFDLRLIETDFLASKLVVVGTRALILDAGKKEIIILNLDSKQFDKADLTDKENIKDITIEDGVNNNAYILSDAVDGLEISNQKITNQIAKSDTTSSSTFLGAFNSSLYLLNQSQSDIVRYTSSDDGFGEGKRWFKTTPNLDFNTISSLAIDGDIWLGTNDGQILKNSTGQRADFTVRGLSVPFSSSLVIATRKDAPNLYVLEPNKNRLVILTKEGEFLSEVISPSLALANSLSVSDDLKTVYLTAGSVLYQLQIEN